MASSTSASAPLVAPAFDLEHGHNADTEEEETALDIALSAVADRLPEDAPVEGQDFSTFYYYVYIFSMFMMAVGTWDFFFPFSTSTFVKIIMGPGGLVTGIFLVLNTDLLVTYLRLVKEMGRLKENNRQFRTSLVEQKKKIRKLHEAEKALAEFEEFCGGSMGQLAKEMGEMTANARDSTRLTIAGMLSITRPKQEDVLAGKDLQTIVQSFSNTYVRAFPRIDERFAEMHKGLEASPRWQRVQSLSVNRLKLILASVFFDEIKDIKEAVMAKVEAESDRLASTRSENSLDAKKEKVTASVPMEEDPWAEAAAFAEGDRKKVPAALPEEEDPWADAAAFAGVD